MATEQSENTEVVPVKQIWIHEAHEFTPWLAKNLPLLGETLGMELELVEQEAWTGDYNGDILADDQKSDAAVVIEHRTDETYHYQLGQVLTCAEDYDARILIWIADNFREEHRAALDWLNRWTSKDIEVYGVEIRNAQESDADDNLKFVPVVAPSSWLKSGESGQITKVHSVVLREFFQALNDDLSTADFVDTQKIATNPVHIYPSGLPGIDYHASFEGDLAWVYIPGWQSDNNRILNVIRSDAKKRAKIEAELDMPSGTHIDWKTWANSTGVYRKATFYDPEAELEEIRQWMFDYLLKFREVFNPRMEKIIAEMDNVSS